MKKIGVLSNQRLPTEEIPTYKLTKTLISELKEETWEKTFRKFSSALNVRRLLRRLPWKFSPSVSDLKNMHIQKLSNHRNFLK